MSKAQAQAELVAMPKNGEPAEIVPVPPQSVTPMMLLQIATNQGADLDRLEKLMDLHMRWEANEARKSYDAAMAEFKADAPSITKNKHVQFGQTVYDHATLDHVCERITAGLSKQGISHRWRIEQPEKSLIRVTCILRHRQGHSEETTLEAAADTSGSKNAIQAIGSAVTYLERYTLLAATGLAAKDGDTDGSNAAPMEGLQQILADVKESRTLVELDARYKKAFKEATRVANPQALKAIVATKDERKKELAEVL